MDPRLLIQDGYQIINLDDCVAEASELCILHFIYMFFFSKKWFAKKKLLDVFGYAVNILSEMCSPARLQDSIQHY